MAYELARHNPALDDLAVKFMEHFALISEAMRGTDLWDEHDGFYYDVLRGADGSAVPLRVRSMVGIIPLFSTKVLREEDFRRVRARCKGFTDVPERHVLSTADGRRLVSVGVAAQGRVRRILTHLFDEDSFLSPYGLRALSRWHEHNPFSVQLPGHTASVGYEPAESSTGMFGGNSNWRGPLWVPLNYLVLRTLEDYHAHLGDTMKIEYPAGSGQQLTAGEVAEDLRRRMLSLYRRGPDGRRPAHGWVHRLQHDPNWRDNLLFYEYFHADNGAGLGASHQTGWTGLLAELVARPAARRPERPEVWR
jgi:hypothetical protein